MKYNTITLQTSCPFLYAEAMNMTDGSSVERPKLDSFGGDKTKLASVALMRSDTFE